MKICTIDRCARKFYAKGFCKSHYESNHKYGDPLYVDNSVSPKMAWVMESMSRKETECFTWTFPRNTNGYCRMRYEGRVDYAHRVICTIANGPAPSEKHRAAHRCGKGHEGCLNHDHLRWATNSENQLERRTHGTDNRGEKHPLAKLTLSAVEEIRESEWDSCSARRLAEKFGVTVSNIRAVRSGKGWSTGRYERIDA